uniref:ShKT domain-containing protein n=1 Tax=Acrobeloides nanus TaxID=290746 RepID=A0A914EAR5_9BILA
MPEAHGVWLIFTILLGFVPLETVGQGSCAQAPNPSARIICEQLHKWDTNARSVPPKPKAPTLPAIPGQAALVGAELAQIPTSPYQCMDLNCLCGYIGGNACNVKARRREYRTLSDDERQRYHAAVLALKRSGEYDNIARTHAQFAQAGGAHSGPSFLPWHREFVKRFEIAIRMVDPTLAIPYWDTTLDGALPTPSDSIMFTDAFMGMNDGAGNLVRGPFAGWRTLTGRPNIQRRIGAQGMLLTEQNINYVASANNIAQVLSYTAPRQGCPANIDFNALEYTHGNVHLFVGGDMMDQSTSANDPIFFLLHSFVDYIWEMFRNRQNRFSRETDYPPDLPQCSSFFHTSSAFMSPFEPWNNIDGLSNKYTDNMYEYAPRPQCPACGGSKYLFCARGRCASKIRTGGNCQGFTAGEDACYNGRCVGGRCVGGPPPAARPPVALRPAVVSQTCFNEHECCGTWAANGQCRSNPGYMNQWCKASCSICRPTYAMAGNFLSE